MFTLNESGRLDGDLLEEAVLLEALAADLRRLAAGDMPSEENLAAAPVLSNWKKVALPQPRLAGKVQGHEAPMTLTSGVWVYAPAHGWVRTMSRFYRLGLPADAGRPQ